MSWRSKLLYAVRFIKEKGVFHIFLGSFLTKLVAFFGSIFLVRVLSKHDNGVLGYLENIYGYFVVLAGMGLSNAILRYVVLGRSLEEKYGFYIYACRLGFIWNICLICISEIFISFYPHPGAYKNYTWLLYFMFPGLPFQYLTDNVLCLERAMFANKRYALFSFLLSAALICSRVVFGAMNGISAVIYSQTILYIVFAVLFLWSTKKRYFLGVSAIQICSRKKREILAFSFQYMITNGLWAIFMLNDVFFLGRFCAPEIVAEYKVAYAIPGSITIFSSAIGIFVAPYFVKHENNREWIRRNFKRVFLLTGLMIGVICGATMILAGPIIWMLYGNEYVGIAGLMRILLIAAFCNCGLRYTTANILAAMGEVRYNLLVSILGMLLQLLLDVLIIPKLGGLGVAISSCFVYLFMAIFLLVIFIRKYYLYNR